MGIEDDEMAVMNEMEDQPIASGSGSGLSPADVSSTVATGESKLSKNAQKKAAKQARMRELIPLKRQAEKARRRERSQHLKEGLRAGTLSDADREQIEAKLARDKERKNAIRAAKRGTEYRKEAFGGGVLIDLGFDELMVDNEITSMASQLGYVYSANRLAKRPFSAVLHTSAGPSHSPRLWEKMAKTGNERWNGCHWYDESLGDFVGRYRGVTAGHDSGDGLSVGQGDSQSAGVPDSLGDTKMQDLPSELSPSTHSLVYLSADSEEELTTLSPSDIYIIGGIVDRNRYKNLCQNKAERLDIRTARLPIGKFLEVEGRKVLTVNQVFSILVEYVERQDWRAAFEAVIPPRKIVKHDDGDSTVMSSEDVDEGAGQSRDGPQVDEDSEEAAMNA